MTDIFKMVYEAFNIIENYDFQYDINLQEHLTALVNKNLTVSETQQEILDYLEKNKKGGCLYLSTRFLEEFPEATYGFIPTENPEDLELKRTSNKVIAIVGDRVYDLANAVESKKTFPNDDSLILCIKNCNIPIKEYCKKNLQTGEVLTILPNPKDSASEPFLDYFFRNPSTIEIGL